MRRVLRWTGILIAGTFVIVVVLWFAFPAHVTPSEGPADPILWLRRPVMKGLYKAGVQRNSFGTDGWLPSESPTETWEGAGGPETATTWTRDVRRVEPVYRGIFWRAGYRITLEVAARGEDAVRGRRMRLWYEDEAKRVPVADGERGEPDPDGRTMRWTVHGYVPASASHWGYAWVDDAGVETVGAGWGGN